MADSEKIKATILNLGKNEFFNTDSTLLNHRKSNLLNSDYSGIAVNTPEQISTSHRDTLPLFMAIRYSGERGWNIPVKKNCVVIGTNLLNGKVIFSKAFIEKKKVRIKRDRGKSGPIPLGLARKAALLTVLNPRELLELEWHTSIWRLGVLYYDWPSNTVDVELLGDQKVIFAPKATIFPKSDPDGNDAFPLYLPSDKTPGLPKNIDTAFNCEFSRKDQQQHLIIHGSFKLKARHFHIPDKKIVHTLSDKKQRMVQAVVPVTLAVLKLNWNRPRRIDWAIPVYGDPILPGMISHGIFAIDALSNGRPLESGKYICYLVIDGRIFGPKEFEVPDKDLNGY